MWPGRSPALTCQARPSCRRCSTEWCRRLPSQSARLFPPTSAWSSRDTPKLIGLSGTKGVSVRRPLLLDCSLRFLRFVVRLCRRADCHPSSVRRHRRRCRRSGRRRCSRRRCCCGFWPRWPRKIAEKVLRVTHLTFPFPFRAQGGLPLLSNALPSWDGDIIRGSLHRRKQYNDKSRFGRLEDVSRRHSVGVNTNPPVRERTLNDASPFDRLPPRLRNRRVLGPFLFWLIICIKFSLSEMVPFSHKYRRYFVRIGVAMSFRVNTAPHSLPIHSFIHLLPLEYVFPISGREAHVPCPSPLSGFRVFSGNLFPPRKK